MIQTGITLSSTFKFLQKYLNIIIIVPAFFGGLWQLIELSTISITYIRFFSLSQIVPDGLLILLWLILGLLSSMVGYFANTFLFIKKNKKTEVLPADDYEKYRKFQLKIWLAAFVTTYALALFYYIKSITGINNISNVKTDSGIAFLFLIFINGSLNNCFNFAKEKHKQYFKFCNSLLFMLYLFIGFYLCRQVHNLFVSTNNFQNIEKVKNEVRKKFPNTRQELLYFNDKYIFLKISDTTKKKKTGEKIVGKESKVYIMELEKLF